MSKYYTNPIHILYKTESGKLKHMKPNPDSDNLSWYFTETPTTGSIIEIGKEYYEVVNVIYQAIRNRNMYDNPRHKPSTILVKYLGRFDKVDLLLSSVKE